MDVKSVAIACVDTMHYEKTIAALANTLQTLSHLNIKKVYWFSDIAYHWPTTLPVVASKIPKINQTDPTCCYNRIYSEVMLRTLPNLLSEDFVLIIHADGFAVNSSAWTDEFFNYDYVGAVWANVKNSWWCENLVGNGGFCLRSQKLMKALVKINPPLELHEYWNTPLEKTLVTPMCPIWGLIPEDNLICRWYRQRLEKEFDIRFAPNRLADQFSIENNMNSPWLGKSVGFHGKHGVHLHYGVNI